MDTEKTDDELLREATEVVIGEQKASTDLLQRRLSIGYGKAAKLLEELEKRHIISEPHTVVTRDVLYASMDTASYEIEKW